MNNSLPGSSVHGVFQAKILEWVAISFSRFSPIRDWTWVFCIAGRFFTSWAIREAPLTKLVILKCKRSFESPSSLQSLCHVQLFVTSWITARQASLSITNSRSSLKLMSMESVMQSSHLILCHPLLLLPPIPPSIRDFFQWVNSSHEVAKVLEFQLQHQSFQWTPRTDLL